MIIYGTGEKRIKPNQVRKPICPNCGKNSINFYIFYKYPHIFWIPLFPISKRSVAICEECSIGYDKKTMPESLEFENKDVRAMAKTPPYLFIGALLIILSIITVAYLSDGKTTYHYPSGNKQAEGKTIGDDMDGEWTFWHENGSIETTQFYNKGIEDSVWSWYYEDGTIEKEGWYKDGMYHGKWTFYYTNGQKEAVETFSYNRLEGLATYWYENGQKQAEGNFHRNMNEGKWTYWYDNGKVRDEGSYVDGSQAGNWISYYESGQKMVQTNTLDSKTLIVNFWNEDGKYLVQNSNGIYSTFHANGKKESQGHIKNGLPFGKWDYWYENGSSKEKGTYKNQLYLIQQAWNESGELTVNNGNGFQADTYSNGVIAGEGAYENGLKQGNWSYKSEQDELMRTITYKDGIENGKSSSYHHTGELLAEGEFVHGEQEGAWTWYYSSGLKECTVNFTNGKKEGEQIFWNEAGKVIKTEVYEAGELISESAS